GGRAARPRRAQPRVRADRNPVRPFRGRSGGALPQSRADMKNSIAVVLKCYPRLSETFIAQEIHALESAGFDLTLVSLRHPTDRKTHPVNDEIRAPVVYLPEYLYQEPLRVFNAWRKARK